MKAMVMKEWNGPYELEDRPIPEIRASRRANQGRGLRDRIHPDEPQGRAIRGECAARQLVMRSVESWRR